MKKMSSTAADLARGVASTVIALGNRIGADRESLRALGHRIDDAVSNGSRYSVSELLTSARQSIRALMPEAVAPEVVEHNSAWPFGPKRVRGIVGRKHDGPHAPSTCEISAGVDEVDRALRALSA